MQTPDLLRRSTLRGALSFAAFASVAGAQNQTWIRQLGSSASDGASAVTADGAGGVFLCGGTSGDLFGSNAGGGDAWLARYDAAGNRTWVLQFGSTHFDTAKAVASDGAGGVYVSGFTGGIIGASSAGQSDVWLARHDSSGNQSWVRQFGSMHADYAVAAASDGAGGVFLCGSTSGDLFGSQAGAGDAWLARFDSAGNVVWTRQFGSPGGDGASGVASDGSGGMYVSGSTDGSLGGPNAGESDAWFARYDGAGNQTWIRQLGTSSDDDAAGVAPDGLGSVYVTGRTGGSLGGSIGGNFDAWLARYDGAGNQYWIRQLGTDDSDIAQAAAADGSGGLYVAGWTHGDLGGPTAGTRDAWLARYDGAGNLTLIQQLGTSTFDESVGIVADGAGGAHVCGLTAGSLGGPNAGIYDAWLARYEGGVAATRYCTPAIPNSTGRPGRLDATGNNSVAANHFTLEANQLPLSSFGFFLTSRDQGDTYPVSFSQGRLCLGGFIGRYVGPGQVVNSGATGSFSLPIDLTSMPQPLGNVAARPGETWNFQAWHRDANPTATSNFTDAIAVMFL